MKIKPTNALYHFIGDTEGVVVAQETRDGESWLVVEFPTYGMVILPATEFVAPAG